MADPRLVWGFAVRCVSGTKYTTLFFTKQKWAFRDIAITFFAIATCDCENACIHTARIAYNGVLALLTDLPFLPIPLQDLPKSELSAAS